MKVKDSSVICDPGFVEFLCALAEEKKIPYQREILEGGGTDTCAMQVAGGGSHATAISVPTRYIHSNAETICKKDYDACVALTAGTAGEGAAVSNRGEASLHSAPRFRRNFSPRRKWRRGTTLKNVQKENLWVKIP